MNQLNNKDELDRILNYAVSDHLDLADPETAEIWREDREQAKAAILKRFRSVEDIEAATEPIYEEGGYMAPMHNQVCRQIREALNLGEKS